jgi:hypoxanthine phosphoribosyltransferase
VDYVHATRYRGGIVGHDLEWRTKPHITLKDRTVLVVDDILDGGVTLQGIIDYCKEEGAKEVFSAVLVEKDAPREIGGMLKADFTGVRVENRYVFGYGMDYKRYLRNTRGIFAVAEEDE